jgi:hypothetical protein
MPFEFFNYDFEYVWNVTNDGHTGKIIARKSFLVLDENCNQINQIESNQIFIPPFSNSSQN